MMDNEKSFEAYKTYRLIFVEWITTIAVLLGCFGYLTYKIEKQADRTDRLYEMFIDLIKEGRR
jgi:hypothetical protein